MADMNSQNTSGGIDEWGDEINNVEKQKWKTDNNLYSKFYKDFFDYQISEQWENTKIWYIQKLFNTSKEDEIKQEMKSFIWDNEEYKNLDFDKLYISSLQNEWRSFYIKINNARSKVKNKVFKEYDITKNIYNSKLKSEISNLTEKELNDLLYSKNLELFLWKILKSNTPSKKAILNIFNEISWISESKIKELDKKTNWKLGVILLNLNSKYWGAKMKSLDNADLVSIRDLFRYEIVSKDFKIKFLENYLSNLSLDEYSIIFNLSEEKINKKKKEIVKSLFSEVLKWKTSDEIEVFTSQIDNKDLIVEISSGEIWKRELVNLLNSDIAFNKILEEYRNDYNKWFTDLKEQIELNEFEWGLSTFDDFKKHLSENKKINNTSNFKEWNIIFLNTKEAIDGEEDSEWKKSKEVLYTKTFLKIHKIHEKTWEIVFLDYGSNDLYTPSGTREIRTDYFSFLKYLENGDVNIDTKIESWDIYTPTWIQSKVNSWEFKKDKSCLTQKTFDSVSREEDEYIREYKINKLVSEWKSKDSIDEEDIINFQIDRDDEEFQDWLEEITLFNYYSLLSSVDEIDEEGKNFWLNKWTTFLTKKWDFFTISNIDKSMWIITISSPFVQDQDLSFQDFFDWFKDSENECIRTSWEVDSIEKLYDNVSNNLDSWKKFKIKDGKIVKKSTNEEDSNKKTNIEYDYLVSSKWDEFYKWANLVQIESISGWIAKVRLWEIKDEDESNKDNDKIVYSMYKWTYTVDLSMLESWINKSKLEPESLKSNKDFIEEKQESDDRKWSFSSKLFSRLSFNEIIKWWELWAESIKSYLEEWNEEHAAKFASWFLGKILPSEVQFDLKSRMESSQKKRMDDYKQRLKDLDSWDATVLVRKWLDNKNSPEPQKEAAMIFMLENYGSLYTKWALFPSRWKYLWYKAMWWTVWDELFNEKKEECDRLDIQFTEEDLVYDLVKRQCKRSWWYLGIKRRGRLYKEVEALGWKGRDEEFEKWKKDAAKKRGVWQRVDFAIDELYGWSYPNAMWAFEEIVWKWDWWDMTTLNKLPFVMAFSWLGYDFDQKMVDNFKNNPANWMPVISTMFISNPSMIEIFSEVILELSKDLKEIHWWKYNDIVTDAKKIFKEQKTSINPEKKIENTVAFFDNYWEALTRSMNMLSTWKTDNLSKTDQIILLNKDKEWKGIYKKYYNIFIDLTENNSDFSKEDYITDAFNPELWSWIIWMNAYKVSKDNLSMVQWGWFRNSKSWPMVWKSFIKAIDEIKNTDYSDIWNNEDIKKEIIKNKLRWLLGWLLHHHWSNQNALSWFFDKGTSPFYSKFHEWDIKSKDFSLNNMWSERLMDEKDKWANDLLNRYVNNILEWQTKEVEWFSIPQVEKDIKSATENVIDSNYKK